MIVCPNCNHPNPDGAVQCEACYTPLPATTNCPNCGATVQSDAAFCGQCGFNLHSTFTPAPATAVATVAPDVPVEVPPLVNPEPIFELLQPNALGIDPAASAVPPTAMAAPPATPPAAPPATPTVAAPIAPPGAPPVVPPVAPPAAPPQIVAESTPPAPAPEVAPPPVAPAPIPEAAPEPVQAVEAPTPAPEPAPAPAPAPAPQPVAAPSPARTQLQQITARLVHIQSDREIELPPNLSVIHIGKPNDRIPPDIDVSGFANSEIVSRVHADIRVEGDAYYIEDVGSSNGTYINNLPLLPGNRHRLRPGDRISLGKGDLVTFLFKLV